jgi:hypothetical protein
MMIVTEFKMNKKTLIITFVLFISLFFINSCEPQKSFSNNFCTSVLNGYCSNSATPVSDEEIIFGELGDYGCTSMNIEKKKIDQEIVLSPSKIKSNEKRDIIDNRLFTNQHGYCHVPINIAQCSNGADDDGDGLIDFEEESTCGSALTRDQTDCNTFFGEGGLVKEDNGYCAATNEQCGTGFVSISGFPSNWGNYDLANLCGGVENTLCCVSSDVAIWEGYTYCGDGVCEGDENETNCLLDCTGSEFCGDGACNGNETFETCPEDCDEEGTCSLHSECEQNHYCHSTGICVEYDDNYCFYNECYVGDGDCNNNGQCIGDLDCNNDANNCNFGNGITPNADCCVEGILVDYCQQGDIVHFIYDGQEGFLSIGDTFSYGETVINVSMILNQGGDIETSTFGSFYAEVISESFIILNVSHMLHWDNHSNPGVGASDYQEESGCNPYSIDNLESFNYVKVRDDDDGNCGNGLHSNKISFANDASVVNSGCSWTYTPSNTGCRAYATEDDSGFQGSDDCAQGLVSFGASFDGYDFELGSNYFYSYIHPDYHETLDPISSVTGDHDARCILNEHKFAPIYDYSNNEVATSKICAVDNTGYGAWFTCDSNHKDITYSFEGVYGQRKCVEEHIDCIQSAYQVNPAGQYTYTYCEGVEDGLTLYRWIEV